MSTAVQEAMAYNRARVDRLYFQQNLPPFLQNVYPTDYEDHHNFYSRIRLLQRAHGLYPDGKLGTVTLTALRTFDHLQDIPLRGKGMWLWQENHLGSSGIRKMQEAGVSFVLIKVADRRRIYNADRNMSQSDALRRLIRLFDRFEAADIVPVPWVYSGAYGETKHPTQLLDQARLHVDLARRFASMSMLVVNAETYFQTKRRVNGELVEIPKVREHAKLYIRALRDAGVPLGLSTYGFVQGQGTFAWEELMGGVDLLMPQVYWSVKRRTSNDPIQGTADSILEWSDKVRSPLIRPRGAPSGSKWEAGPAGHRVNQLIVPSGACYQRKDPNGEGYSRDWHRPTTIRTFMERMELLCLPFCLLWTYKTPTTLSEGQGSFRVTAAQWDAFSQRTFTPASRSSKWAQLALPEI